MFREDTQTNKKALILEPVRFPLLIMVIAIIFIIADYL